MTYSNINHGVLRLVVAGEVQRETSFPLPTDVEVLLGRDPSCDVPLDAYTSVSRRHAEIRPLNRYGGEWVIYDLNSSNGTYINGKRLQGGQVLRVGDRISLTEDGPEFLFEYQQLTPPIPATENQSQPVLTRHTIKESTYCLELFPTRLDIERKVFGVGEIIISCISIALSGFFIVAWIGSFLSPGYSNIIIVLILLFFTLLTCFTYSQEVRYSFDLETDNLVITSQTFVEKLLNRSRCEYYPLKEFTAVRLDKSRYEGDEGTKYDEYSIYLERETGKALKLAIKWRNNIEKAKEMVNVIEQYLQ
ncbi:MAG: FHA domain-containing protein [Stigonema ocellatum SAG 48.90 = DSM 106950]|nr:FHA domain-containing protein [Stigonema ocellatum SAG 48.90 = DSM 106950]